MKISQKYKSVAIRFLKAFLSGGFSAMVLVVPFSGQSVKDIGMWLVALTTACFVGGITGIVMAGEKWARWEE